MATNSFYNIADITPMIMDVIENTLTFTKHVNRGYDDRFRETGGKIGDTANIRIPGFYTASSGKVATPQGVNETYVPVTLNQINVPIKLSSKELRLNVDDLQNYLKPMAVAAANKIDADGTALITQIPSSTGTPGTAPTDLQYFLNAGAVLDQFGVPRDGERSAVLDPWTQASMVQGLKGLFQDSTSIADQYKQGTMGLAAGMKFSMDQNIPNYTIGTLVGTPLVSNTPADGDATISINGWSSSSSTLNKGDVLTFSGCNAVNPVSKLDTGQLMQFVVTATISDSSGTMTGVAISPSLTLTGPTQNIKALPANGATVKVFGAATTYSAKVSPANCVFHKDAFLMASADLPNVGSPGTCSRIRSKKLDLSIRLAKYWDGVNDDELYRLDVLYGWAILRPTFACRVQG